MSIADALSREGICVEDHYLDAAGVRALLDCALARRAQGTFQGAKVGAFASLQRDVAVRGDSTCWLQEPLYPAERELLNGLEQLRLTLNRELYCGLVDLELHYAWYPPGAGYERHVDQPQGSLQRQVSLVLYLNETWSDAGGELRFFEADSRCRDIAPLGGRLVCFRTPGREHAVLPASRDRFSVSGWFRARQ